MATLSAGEVRKGMIICWERAGPSSIEEGARSFRTYIGFNETVNTYRIARYLGYPDDTLCREFWGYVPMGNV